MSSLLRFLVQAFKWLGGTDSIKKELKSESWDIVGESEWNSGGIGTHLAHIVATIFAIL